MISKTCMIAICGRPNVGKSTLANALAGEKIAIVSDKPQTTRNRITAICQRDETQFVFLDTPGFHKPRTRLGDYMVGVVRQSVADVDAVVLVVEPVASPGPQERELIKSIKSSRVPAVLAINKIDTVPHERLLEVIAAYSREYDFAAVVPISARTGDGVEELKKELIAYLPLGPKYFPDDMLTDQPERDICAELIREKALRNLRDEVPHGIGVEMMAMKKLNDHFTEIDATIYCERDSHKGIIIGKKGAMLQKIGAEARADIEALLDTHVNLQLWVKVRPGWRDSTEDLKTLGYVKDR